MSIRGQVTGSPTETDHPKFLPHPITRFAPVLATRISDFQLILFISSALFYINGNQNKKI
ncbi:MAG: hypothetical protein EBU34_01355 [Alphaproteobacteria bacterium]|nr:hypothetical protein [Alphaproteobacteria bacterium]